MCTGAFLKPYNPYFGRNLDLSTHFGEKVIFFPRNSSLVTKAEGQIKTSYSILGIGAYLNNFPLYADAMNECGLAMAGLYYPGNAFYFPKKDDGCRYLAPYELIPYLLGKYKTVEEALTYLKNLKILKEEFMPNLPLTDLHFLLADEEKRIVLEPDKDGLKIYANPYDILTNNPSFPIQESFLSSLANLSNTYPKNQKFPPDSIGFGAISLPGDQSSRSRFMRGAYLLAHQYHFQNEDLEKEVASCFSFFSKMAFYGEEALDQDNRAEETIYTSLYSLKDETLYWRKSLSEKINKISFKDLKDAKAIDL